MAIRFSLVVFPACAIFHDACFMASESPKAWWFAIICAAGAVNLCIAICRAPGKALDELFRPEDEA